ncbi:unnamed protein product [Orchesella dallaii]|uniref:Uncharacterized protein n=1 Tax=Orchesella dallaii TaxID=48710 RepID=A0ABP1RAF5_9HEXA
MRDVDKPSSSNHHHHHHKSGGNNSKNNGKTDVKGEVRRGLEILDKIVNEVAQAKWILKGVLDHLEETDSKPAKCVNCNGNDRINDRKKESPSKDKKDKDKKAKKAVLPMVSGHTVQRPKINLLRVDDQRSRDREPQPGRSGGSRAGGSGRVSSSVKRGRNSRDDDEERGGKKRRSASRSRSRGRSSVRSGKSKKRVSSSSSSSSSSSGSSSSGSSSSSSRSTRSRSTPAAVRKKPSHQDDELLSVGGSGSDMAVKRKQDPKPSTSVKQKKPNTSNADGSKTSPVHPHGSASSKFLSSAQSIEVLKKKHKLKEIIIKLPNVSKLMKYQNKVNLNELKESDVQVFWRTWKAKKKEPPKPATPPPPPRKMIGPKSKMAGLKAKADAEASKKPQMTSAEVLRAKLREKFQKFKMQKMSGGGGDGTQTLPDSTSGVDAKPQVLKTDNKAAHKELAAIGLSVYVSAKTEQETVNDVVGKALANDRSELLEMKRDQWTMMPNPRTGVDSIKEEVQKGIRKAVGDDDDFSSHKKDNTDQYVLGNYYLVSKEGQPLQLMRYMGASLGDLPPCASEEDSGAPSGFVPLDISSLSKSQFNMLQDLGNNRGSTNSETSHKTVKIEMSDSEEDDDGGFGVTIPNVAPEDESDVD